MGKHCCWGINSTGEVPSNGLCWRREYRRLCWGNFCNAGGNDQLLDLLDDLLGKMIISSYPLGIWRWTAGRRPFPCLIQLGMVSLLGNGSVRIPASEVPQDSHRPNSWPNPILVLTHLGSVSLLRIALWDDSVGMIMWRFAGHRICWGFQSPRVFLVNAESVAANRVEKITLGLNSAIAPMSSSISSLVVGRRW